MAERVRQPLVMHLVGVDPPEGNGAYRRLHRVWKGLPKEVLERVLLWLPVADQVRLAAVCKAWRLLLCSRGFQEARASLGLACRPQVSILDWHGGDDRTSSFHQVTVDLSFVTPSKYRAPGVWVKVRAVCGLLCMEAQKEWSRTREWQYSFCIVNVANKTWKELPPLGLTDLWQPFLSVKADDTSSGFQVFALFWGNGELCFALYSSTTGVWSAVTVLQGVVDYGLSVLASVLCDGVLYLLAGWKKIEVMVFDAEDGTMLSCHDTPLAGQTAKCDLSTQCGRLFFTASIGRTSIRIWEYGDSGEPWIPVSSLPTGLLPDVCREVELLNVSDADGVIYVSIRSFEESPFMSPCFDHLLAYSIAQTCWDVVLTVPVPEDCDRKGFLVVELRPYLYL